MFLTQFKINGLAMVQIFVMAGLGYALVKKNVLSYEGLNALSRLLIQAVFPALIFSHMLRGFSFRLYPDWWIFPLSSMAIAVTGLAVGWVLLKLSGLKTNKLQFLSLVAFQNSGYLPLAIAAALFTGEQAEGMFIFIILFLLGFDLVFWSLGNFLLTYRKDVKFRPGSIFSPPVIANLTSLVLVFLGWNRFIPDVLFKPITMVGDCTLPLAMIIVGGNIAMVRLKDLQRKAIFFSFLGKMVILPVLGLILVLKLSLPYLLGFLIVMQLAMPSATSLSVVISRFDIEDALISQGVCFNHLAGLFTIPLFLSIYLYLVMLK
ncbi:MAG: AEC family transporter [Candidatus Omnitrophica bacterium]|jgi:hypothetical protein|nr:AEC family transporter [Candidatus Omnitrophota bacterium]MDD5078589.1 AEC family transporter [Candidatus Omnitrophota bacterium]MDD5725347.1 AEC family transporter [Candidatus Omnitrophota bacterium]